MAKIVVLGGGVGGVSMAYEIRKALPQNHQVCVISERDKFEFTPSNPWVAVGWRSGDQVRVDLNKPFKKRNIELIAIAAEKVMPEQKSVRLVDGQSVEYDYLVIATGPALAFDDIEGLGPEGYTTSVCTTGHAELAALDF